MQWPPQCRPSNDSQLCREESWERIYYPPDMDALKPPMDTEQRSRASLFSTIKDKLLSKCCDLKERYSAGYSLCKEKEKENEGRCRLIYHGYIIRSKAIVLILLMNTFFSTAVCGMGTELLKFTLGSNYTFTPLAVTWGVMLLLFPILGHVSDTYVSRHKMMHYSMWCSWISLSIIGIALSFSDYSKGFDLATQYGLLPVVFVVLCVSFVCFMSNVIPFSLDQLQGASHVHYSSFFYWWYWTFSIGVAVILVPDYCSNNASLRLLLQVEISVLCLTTVLVLNRLFSHWFVIEPHLPGHRRPILKTLGVLCYAITPHANQRIPSSVHHELDFSNCNRLELAKKRYGGMFETEDVENTRTLLNILSIFLPIGVLLISFFGVFNTVKLVQSHLKATVAKFSIQHTICDFEILLLSVLRPVLMLVLVPVLDLLVLPVLRYIMLHPSILKRLGLGVICTLLSVLSMLALVGVGEQSFSTDNFTCILSEHLDDSEEQMQISSPWLAFSIVLVTVAEIFIYIPGFEFVCSQAPYNMRGLFVGLFFSIQGLSSLLSILIQYLFVEFPVHWSMFKTSAHFWCGSGFYLVLACIAVVGMILYFIAACRFKNRKRDDVFNQVGMLEEYFSSGKIHSSRWI